MLRTDPFDPRAIGALVNRIFPRATRLAVEFVAEGVSTHVYRIRRADNGEVFYLRVLPEEGASFAPKARVHALLRERGARAPEVVYVEDRNDVLGRAVMVTTEIKGRHIGHRRADAEIHRALVEGGRDLAIINSIPVEGFGWIKREGETGDRLEADRPSYRAFALDHLADDLALLGAYALGAREVGTIGRVIERHAALLGRTDARLAHGDFGVTHIYQQDGRYTGIIDFGEIRGADPLYDLGHVALHDGETLPARVLPYLLEGYQTLTPLPPDYERRLHLASLLIGVKALARQLGKPPHARSDAYVTWLTTSIRDAIGILQR